jgi:uncharacterized NAD(P)/FAD-binding protein YdhS
MGAYLLKHLSTREERLDITIFEAAETPGCGMPYREGMNADYMYCNAFSREIPSFTQPLLHWLKDLPPRDLGDWELMPEDVTARAFYPRVLIGEYMAAEFEGLVEEARRRGHTVSLRCGCPIADILPEGDSLRLVPGTGAPERFDDVVIATGHRWPEAPQIGGVPLVSPWPYTRVTGLPPGQIGILGSSLSAIDVVVALGMTHGTFEEDETHVRWLPNDDATPLRITMVSRSGIMPEGDFYYPFPYPEPKVLTERAATKEVERGTDGLLDRVFALLIGELEAEAPEYLEALGRQARSVEGFAPAYFAHRQELGGLRAVKRDLAQTRASMRDRETVPHRLVLLAGHEVFDMALRALSDQDFERFRTHLGPVFADAYAAVPHLSLARIVALYDAGILALTATGEEGRFEAGKDGAVTVHAEDGETLHFDAMVDARGQPAAAPGELPFPSLAAALPTGPAPVIAPFRLHPEGLERGRLYCLALPQVMERYPFAPGLPECAELSELVAEDLCDTVVTEPEDA